MKYSKISLACALFVSAAACGDDDGGGGGSNVDTGLSESQPLSDVTPAQFEEACTSVQATVNARFSDERITRFTCEFASALFSEDAASCRDLADDCVASPPEETEGDMFEIADAADLGCGEPTNTQGCAVTVGEFETCVNDALDAIDQFMAGFSCANAGMIELEQAQMDPLAEPPPSCARLETECPEFFDDSPQ